MFVYTMFTLFIVMLNRVASIVTKQKSNTIMTYIFINTVLIFILPF